jgi:hypothetical protein
VRVPHGSWRRNATVLSSSVLRLIFDSFETQRLRPDDGNCDARLRVASPYFMAFRGSYLIALVCRRREGRRRNDRIPVFGVVSCGVSIMAFS